MLRHTSTGGVANNSLNRREMIRNRLLRRGSDLHRASSGRSSTNDSVVLLGTARSDAGDSSTNNSLSLLGTTRNDAVDSADPVVNDSMASSQGISSIHPG